MKIRKFPFEISIILILLTSLIVTKADIINHQIKFDGMRNGYSNLTLAEQALRDNLRGLTGHDIVIDYIDDNGATWHSETISKMSACPEREIRQLFSMIKSDPLEYTRKFKMFITELFEFPKSASIEWLGPCGSVDRKRSDPIEPGRIQDGSNMNDSATIMTTVTAETSTSASILTKQVDDEVTTTTTSTTTRTTTTVEPIEPTTTTDPPITPPAPEIATTEEPVSSTVTSSTLTPLETMGPLSVIDPETVDNITTTTTTTTVEPIESTTTTDPPITTPITLPALEIATTDGPVSSTPTSSTLTPLDTMGPLSAIDSETVDNITTTTTTTDTTTTGSNSETTIATAQSTDSSEPAYGKFIGLSLAFAIFVAYLVCSRSYSRHGMYELHNE